MSPISSLDFPFTIMDVASLLRLNIRRRGGSQVYADCPVCGDRRGKMSLNPERNVWHCHYCGNGGGMLALYAQVHGISTGEAYREICDSLAVDGFGTTYHTTPQPAMISVGPAQSEQAPVEDIHRTFSALLSMLTLTPEHREHLRVVRGLTDDEINEFGFKSTPSPRLCRSLTERLIKQGCVVAGVPGFYINDYGKWTVKFYQRTSGILIPLRRIDGLLHGLQIRLDHPIRDENDPPDKAGAKYLPLSSAGKNGGTTSGGPVHFVGDPFARVVYVTEGALKADICHALTGRTFAATIGANNVSQLDPLFAQLYKNGTEEIIEADDMDKFRNEMVRRGASKIYQMAEKHGMKCRRLTWNPNYKGIDDWQLALRRKKKLCEEAQEMTFKEQYLSGLCGRGDIDAHIERWHKTPDNGAGLTEYLGLTVQEYETLLRGKETAFWTLLDNQRRSQHFRIYQLNLDGGRVVPFAFSGIDRMRKAGFDQPPASVYRLVYDGIFLCPNGQSEEKILQRIFERFGDELPRDYHGRSVAPSDVIELYGEGVRAYFYRDEAGFVPVKFSPMLIKSAKNA